MDAGLVAETVLVASLCWLVGQSFISAFFERKEEMIKRMIDNEEGE